LNLGAGTALVYSRRARVQNLISKDFITIPIKLHFRHLRLRHYTNKDIRTYSHTNMIFILTYMHICIHTYIQKAIQTYKQQTYIHTNLQTYLKYRKGEREHRERSNKRDSKEDRKRDKGRQP